MFKTSSTTTFLPSNIMLHFPLEKSENLYNGVCNWDMASRVVENKSSFYGYQTKAEVEENIAQRKHVAPKLVYVLGSQDSQNSLEVIKMNHLYSKATDAYSVGILEIERPPRQRSKDKVIHFGCFDAVHITSF
jgi:hypothetical protein